MRPVKDRHGDTIEVRAEQVSVYVRSYQSHLTVASRTVMRYTPAQARNLARKLLKAADKAEL